MPKKPKGTVGLEAFQGRLRLRLPRSVCGKNRYLTLGLADTPKNRQIAEAKAKLIESDIVLERFDSTLERYKPPGYVPPTPVTNEYTLLELWRFYTEFKSHSLSATTLNSDFRKIQNHLKALPTHYGLANSKQIRDNLLGRLSPDATRRVLMQLNACCRWAQQEGLIQSNPFVNLPAIKVFKNRSINPFTREERDLIIEVFTRSSYYSYYTPFVKFLFWTGCRTSEAIGLQWQHIDPGLKFISFEEALVDGIRKETKTHGTRKFPANKALKELLQTIQPDKWQPDQPVFTSKEGLTVDPHNFLNRAWRSIVGGLPIKYRPQYNTRHTFISLCLDDSIPVTQVANWVGNSPKTIWTHYAGLVSAVKVPEP